MSNKFLSVTVFLLFVCALKIVFADSVVESKHNLSIGGPGTILASVETDVCIFCHTPHNASAEAPLWNRFSSGSIYSPYYSSTAIASPGQPGGASKLCLSCHDGTVALGMVRSRSGEIAFPGDGNIPAGSTNIGTDLTDDHPISFVYSQSLYLQHEELMDPALLIGEVGLDKDGQLQCTSCHDPHDNQFGKFLVMANQNSALCGACHNPTGWTDSIHRTATAVWNGNTPDPWPHTDELTVAANSCENCHSPHAAETPQRLIVFAPEEYGCLSCHNGNVAVQNLDTEFTKSSVHPVGATEVHDPTEDGVNPVRHVECTDCHNPHEATVGGPTLPYASGALKGVRGVGSAGNMLADVSFEYELCFRCHADSIDRGSSLVSRQHVQTNTRLEFGLTSASHHAILGPGRNPDVPSLLSPYTTESVLTCTSCHNNNTGPAAGGSGPNGPHGSVYRPLLERRLLLIDGRRESQANYALCYKCHSRTSILDDRSFSEHKKHLEANTACATCHDPHGVENNSHLINFNLQVVSPSSSGRLEYIDTGRYRGSCFLRCHGENHDPFSY
jgi:predicted CXXCH cytochrome family protein